MKPYARAFRFKLELFDSHGLDAETVKTMRLLIAGVVGGMVWTNITTGIAMTGFLKDSGMSDFLYSVIIALPNLMNAFQFLASWWMERTLRRRSLFLVFGFIQRVIWFPFAIIPFVFPQSAAALRIWGIAILSFVSAAAAPFMNVAFFSICSDVIPIKRRGRYFAARSRISSIAGLLIGILTGLILDRMPGYPGYAMAFVIAAVFGTADICCFLFMKLPEMKPTEGATTEGPFRMLFHVMKDRHYLRMVILFAVFCFNVALCSSFFNVCMLEQLHMSNLNITLLGQVTSNLALVLFIANWGKAIDRYGSRPIFLIGGVMAGVMPISWVFMRPGMEWLVFLTNFWSGACWCSIDLSMQNLFMSQSRDENRSMYTALYFIATQLFGWAIGKAMGGWLVDNVLWRLETQAITRYNWLFLIAGCLRVLTIIGLHRMVKEEGAASVPQVLGRAAVNARTKLHAFATRKPRRGKKNDHV